MHEPPPAELESARCPRCGSADLRLSPPASIVDRFYAVFRHISIRCRACHARFYATRGGRRFTWLVYLLPTVAVLAIIAQVGFLIAYALSQPSAIEVVDGSFEAAGGKQLLQSIHNEVSTGTISVLGTPAQGSISIYKAEPAKSLSVVQFPGAAPIEEGTNGVVAWIKSPQDGIRIKTGEERMLALRGAVFHPETRWRELFKKTDLTAIEMVNGRPCYQLTLTPPEGHPEIRLFDKRTNLPAKSVVLFKTAQGDTVRIEVYFGDYREEGGITAAHQITFQFPNQQVMIRINNIRRNVPISASRFEPPAAVKTLLSTGSLPSHALRRTETAAVPRKQPK